MAFFAGFFWLIFSPAFQTYLQLPDHESKPMFLANCSRGALFEYKGISTDCSSDMTASGYKHYFESAVRPGRFLSSRCSNLTMRRGGHLNNAFELQKSRATEDQFQLVQHRTKKVLVVGASGEGKFVDATLVHSSPVLQSQASLKVIAVRRKEGGAATDDVCELYRQDTLAGII